MAMSNYDTMALNARGEPINGVFVSKLGVSVAIYKNWLYVRDEKAWVDGGAFVTPTVMQISSGNLKYKDVEITAKRGPQDGVYCVVTTRSWDRVLKNTCKRCKRTATNFHASNCPVVFGAMIGIGCYAYSGKRSVGVTKKSVAFLKRWLNQFSTLIEYQPRTSKRPGKRSWKIVRSKSYEFEDEIRSIPLGKALRFNQGDQFFARNLNFKTPATKVGSAKKSILEEGLKRVKKGA